jgi:hypothetical protein
MVTTIVNPIFRNDMVKNRIKLNIKFIISNGKIKIILINYIYNIYAVNIKYVKLKQVKHQY